MKLTLTQELKGNIYRQCLPVVPRGGRVATVKASLKSSKLWKNFKSFQLKANHRLETEDLEHAQWLLDVGDGLLRPTDGLNTDTIQIPQEMVSQNIANDIFPCRILPHEAQNLKDGVILCPKNDQCDSINADIINRIEGRLTTYYSVDSIISDEEETENLFPPEFLHTCYASGLPPHELNLKIGCLVILLRNIHGK